MITGAWPGGGAILACACLMHMGPDYPFGLHDRKKVIEVQRLTVVLLILIRNFANAFALGQLFQKLYCLQRDCDEDAGFDPPNDYVFAVRLLGERRDLYNSVSGIHRKNGEQKCWGTCA